MNFKSTWLTIATLFFGLWSFAQPSDATLKSKVNEYYNSSSGIVSIDLGNQDLEKRWVRDGWKYYWSKPYTAKVKTEYPGVYKITYGGVQYLKSGSSYSFDRILVGGFSHYEGIPLPSRSEINAHLKANFDPLNFYPGYSLNYITDAPNTIKLAEDPKWKWLNLNELRCWVTTTYTCKTNDIGGMEEQKGTFEIVLKRSVDGKTYDKEAKLLNNGKWLPASEAFKKNIVTLQKFNYTKEEAKSMKTLAQLNAVRAAEEFKKSLAIVEIPEFKSGNHLMQFTHELLLEGDEAKVTAFMYQMLPRNFFEEWSEVVLNQNGQRMLAEATEDLPNYKRAFCQHPVIKEIGATYVRFYDRSKKRFNKISISWENDRWYIYDIGYTIRAEDFPAYESSGEDNCEGNLIFIDEPAVFAPGDRIEVLERGTWFAGEVISADMSNGGYNVKYGNSGLKAWKFVNEVRAGEAQANDVFKEFKIGERVEAKYSGVWYKGDIKKVSYEREQYLVYIDVLKKEEWLSSSDLEPIAESTNSNANSSTENESNSTRPKKKIKLKVPKVRLQ